MEELNDLTWRKASRSTSNGGQCIEVASVPPAWRKASHSGTNGGDCVELASVAAAIAVRDSKDPDGPKLLVSRDGFQRLTNAIRDL